MNNSISLTTTRFFQALIQVNLEIFDSLLQMAETSNRPKAGTVTVRTNTSTQEPIDTGDNTDGSGADSNPST